MPEGDFLEKCLVLPLGGGIWTAQCPSDAGFVEITRNVKLEQCKAANVNKFGNLDGTRRRCRPSRDLAALRLAFTA